MNCYFCNKIIHKSFIDEYNCYNCNCTVISSDNESVRFVYLYYKTYYLYLDFHNEYYAIHFNNNRHFHIYRFDNLPNITPQNIESKINTILAFL